MRIHFFTAPFVCYRKFLSGSFSGHFLRYGTTALPWGMILMA